GVVLDDGYKTAPCTLKILSSDTGRSEVVCVITEGKNRQVRRMFAAIDQNVCYLKRVAVGDIKLGTLKKGTYRMLTDEEVEYLKKFIHM
ncbi:MAG: hypothetical protein RR389_08055, partial [Christensenella sp.]